MDHAQRFAYRDFTASRLLFSIDYDFHSMTPMCNTLMHIVAACGEIVLNRRLLCSKVLH